MGILVRGSPRRALYDRKKQFLLSGGPRNELSASENPLNPPGSPLRPPSCYLRILFTLLQTTGWKG